MQRINNGIFATLLFGIAGWEKYEDVPVDGIFLEISFEGDAVDFDVFDCNGLGTGDHRRDDGLYLCKENAGLADKLECGEKRKESRHF